MEEGVCAQRAGLGFEVAASLLDRVLDVGQGVEVLVDDGLVEETPEMLGGLELGRVGRQKDEPQAFGDVEAGLGVPTRPVEDKDDGALAAHAGFAGKQGEQALKQRLGDAVPHVPVAFAGGRRHKGGDIEPFVAVMAEPQRPLPARRPDPARYRLQPDAVLVRAKERDRTVGMACFFLREDVGEFFLKASWSSGLAASGFFGRGAWIDQPIA